MAAAAATTTYAIEGPLSERLGYAITLGDIGAEDINLLIRDIMYMDSYHDFGGFDIPRGKLDELYNIALGDSREDYLKRKHIASITNSDYEKSVVTYFERKLPGLLQVAPNAGDLPVYIQYSELVKAKTGIDPNNIINSVQLNMDAAFTHTITSVNEGNGVVGKKIIDFMFPTTPMEVHITFDANYYAIKDLMKPLYSTINTNALRVKQLITPQNIVDSAYTSFGVFNSDGIDRSTYYIGDKEIQQYSNYFTNVNKFKIKKKGEMAFDGADPYGFTWIMNTVPIDVSISHRNGPSIDYLSEIIECLQTKPPTVNCINDTRGNKASAKYMIDPPLVGTKDSNIRTCFDMKRMGDHEQANAIYNKPDTIFVSGDRLSCLYSRLIGNSTIFVNGTGNPPNIVCYKGMPRVADPTKATELRIHRALEYVNLVTTTYAAIVQTSGVFDKLKESAKSAVNLYSIDGNELKTALVKARARDIYNHLDTISNSIEILKNINSKVRIILENSEVKKAIVSDGSYIRVKNYEQLKANVVNIELKFKNLINSTADSYKTSISFIKDLQSVMTMDGKHNINSEFFIVANKVVKTNKSVHFNMKDIDTIISKVTPYSNTRTKRDNLAKNMQSQLKGALNTYFSTFFASINVQDFYNGLFKNETILTSKIIELVNKLSLPLVKKSTKGGRHPIQAIHQDPSPVFSKHLDSEYIHNAKNIQGPDTITDNKTLSVELSKQIQDPVSEININDDSTEQGLEKAAISVFTVLYEVLKAVDAIMVEYEGVFERVYLSDNSGTTQSGGRQDGGEDPPPSSEDQYILLGSFINDMKTIGNDTTDMNKLIIRIFGDITSEEKTNQINDNVSTYAERLFVRWTDFSTELDMLGAISDTTNSILNNVDYRRINHYVNCGVEEKFYEWNNIYLLITTINEMSTDALLTNTDHYKRILNILRSNFETSNPAIFTRSAKLNQCKLEADAITTSSGDGVISERPLKRQRTANAPAGSGSGGTGKYRGGATPPKEIPMEELETKVEAALQQPNIHEHVYDSTENIVKCVEAIRDSGGEDGWSQGIVENGDESDFETAIKPLVPLILDTLQRIDDVPRNQKGGVSIPAIPQLSKIPGIPPMSLPSMPGQSLPELDIDVAFQMIMDKIEQLDKITKEFAASQSMGLVRYVNDYDQRQDDPEPFGLLALVPPPTPFIGPPAAILSKVKVPARLIVSFVYTIMDILRIILSTKFAQYPQVRKISSVVVAIVDVLNGDWKSALLTFAGFFGESPMIAGEFAKLALYTFNLLNPRIRESIIFGTKDVVKSLLVGFVFKIFQTVSPAPMRVIFKTAVDDVRATVSGSAEDVVDENKLPQLPKSTSPSFEDIQNIQAFIADPIRMCSKEFQAAIEPMKQSALLRMVLQLLGIPTNERERERVCSRFGTTPQSYVDNLAKDRVNAERTEAKSGKSTVAPEGAKKRSGKKLSLGSMPGMGALQQVADIGASAQQAVQNASAAVEGATQAVQGVADEATRIVEGATQAVEGATSAVQGVADGATQAVEGATNAVQETTNKTIQKLADTTANVKSTTGGKRSKRILHKSRKK